MAKTVELGDFGTVKITSTGAGLGVYADGKKQTVPILLAEGNQFDKGYPTPWFAEFLVAGGQVSLHRDEYSRSAHFHVYPEYRGKLERALQTKLSK
jgi:hypothetical protein